MIRCYQEVDIYMSGFFDNKVISDGFTSQKKKAMDWLKDNNLKEKVIHYMLIRKLKKGKGKLGMYVFFARYENIDIGAEENIIIKVDSQMFKSEKEVFLEAMSIAYDLQNEKCYFLGIVFDFIER